MLKYCILSFLVSILIQLNATSINLEEEKAIYKTVYNAPIQLISGEKTTIFKIADSKPLIIALIFTRCGGICTPFLLKLKEDSQLLNTKTNYSYTFLVLSFDEFDEIEDMHTLANRFDLNGNSKWLFGITDSVTRFIQSVNFNPIWNDTIQQFDHEALLVGINRQGFITKKLIGIRDKRDIERLVESVNNKYTPTYRLPTQSKVFSCFNYNPETGKNTPGWGLLFIISPIIITIFVIVFIRIIVRNRNK